MVQKQALLAWTLMGLKASKCLLVDFWCTGWMCQDGHGSIKKLAGERCLVVATIFFYAFKPKTVWSLKSFSDPLKSSQILLKVKTVWCLRHVLLHNPTDV